MESFRKVRSRSNLLVPAVLLVVILLVGLAFLPVAQAAAKKWRNINPTEYTSIPNVQLNSVYVLNGGTGGIGSGNAWEVGNNGTIFHWDGFSWNNQSSGTPCNLNSVNFGSPLTVPMTPISSSVGFIVGGNVSETVCTGQIALFWNGISWFQINTGLLTTHGNLSSVFVTSVSSSLITAVAVGQNATAGTSYFFNGIPPITPASGWTQVFVNDPAGSVPPLTSVYMVSVTEGWAAAKLGRIYHYSGGGWVLAPGVPVGGFPGVDFRSIFMVSTTDGWAVGSNTQIAHYTGGIWTCCVSPLGAPPFPTLRSLTFVSSSEAWAVGDAVGPSTIFHGTGLTGTPSWTPFPATQIPTIRGLRGIHATGGSNIWAVGQTGSILLWDGSVWGSISAPLQTDFNDVFMTGSNDGVAVGNKTSSGFTIVRWDGVKWSRPQGSLAVTDLWGVWELNSGEWWVVGSPVPAGGPHVARFSGGSLADVTPPPGCATCQLLDVFGTASNNVWAVGTGGGPGQSAIAHWAGSGWGYAPTFSPVPAGTTWRSVTFVQGDQNNGWAVGFTTTGPLPLIFEYTATTQWFTVPVLGVPATTQLNSVRFLDSTHGWIAGSNGVILFWNGAAWTPTFTVGSYNLTSIYVDSTTDGWVVGQDTATFLPVFLHYDGTAWTTVAISPPIPLTNVGRLNSLILPPGSDINGFTVGTTAGAPSAASLGMMFHLDPPGGGGGGGSTTTSTTSTSIVTSTSVITTSSATSSASSVSSSTSSTPVTSASTTSTPTTVSTAVVTLTVATTPTTTTPSATTSASSSVSVPMTLPPVPGFPLESIIAGIILGIAALVIVRRRRK